MLTWREFNMPSAANLGSANGLSGNPVQDVQTLREDVRILHEKLLDTQRATLEIINWFKTSGAVRISEGTIDNTVIGGSTPLAGSFTTLAASGLISANGGQIKFPATQAASADANTLDDYEEGTWTPAITFATPGDLSVTYATQLGEYTKIGRLVTVNFGIVTSAFTHTTASGNLNISGLPFAANATSGYQAIGPMTWGGITKAGVTDINAAVLASSSAILLIAMASAATPAIIVAADTPTGGTMRLRGTLAYSI